ncbi:MAG TPA: hypothetical protein VMB05_18555, partial [Solirubrobacteraceae bacterium]|nr:hypothetical protein [Solirubrobacteraceae bacterium]
MHALPFVFALLSAVLLAPALLRTLTEGGHVKANYRGRELPFPFGVLVPAAALLALIPATLIHVLGSREVFYPGTVPISLYALGVIALGLIDDALGEPRSGESVRRGWRGHGAAVLRGELSTGALKAVGSLGLALYAMAELGYRSHWRWLLASGVLVLATNAFNLLDLRPGRSGKAFVLLGLGLSIGAGSVRQLWALGLFVAPALIAAVYDLRERAMLGDTGANLL